MNKRTVISIVILAFAAIAAYSNSFDVPFQFDDKGYIVDNPVISDFKYLADLDKARALDLDYNVRMSLSTRYVANVAFFLNRKFGSLNPAGYHVVNLAIHLVNCAIVFFLVRLLLSLPQMVRSKTSDYENHISFGTGLLFAVHPIQTEAVTYISQRFTSLVALFYLSAIYFYIKSMDSKRWGFYLIAVMSTVVAMKTKETAFTIPLMMTIADFVFFDAGWRKRAKRLALFYLSALIIPLSLVVTDTAKSGMIEKLFSVSRTQTDMSRLDYLFTEFPVIVAYLRLLFLPVNQNIDYDFPIYNMFFYPAVVGSFFTLAVVIIFGVHLIRKAETVDPALRVAGFGILWFFVALLVESSLIPIKDVIFEHRAYLPSVGIFTSFSVGLFVVLSKTSVKKPETAFLAIIIAVSTVLGVATYKRNAVWRDKGVMIEDAVIKSPKKTRTRIILAKYYFDKGLVDKAFEEYRTALENDPASAEAYSGMGTIFDSFGLVDEAMDSFKKAIELNKELYTAYNNLGLQYVKKGDVISAIAQYSTAVAIKPNFADAHYNLAIAYASLGKMEESARHFTAVVELRPSDANAFNNLGTSLMNLNNFDKAAQAYENAVRLTPKASEFHRNASSAYVALGRLDAGIEELKTAIQLSPDDAASHYLLSEAYAKNGMKAESATHLEKARRIDPDIGRRVR